MLVVAAERRVSEMRMRAWRQCWRRGGVGGEEEEGLAAVGVGKEGVALAVWRQWRRRGGVCSEEEEGVEVAAERRVSERRKRAWRRRCRRRGG